MESVGMSTLCFDSGEQFLDSGASHKAACLIADIRMPGMSGIELQAKLKAERCKIPIIFITGRGDIPMAVSAMKEGASDFFTKPVDGTSPSSVDVTLVRIVIGPALPGLAGDWNWWPTGLGSRPSCRCRSSVHGQHLDYRSIAVLGKPSIKHLERAVSAAVR